MGLQVDYYREVLKEIDSMRKTPHKARTSEWWDRYHELELIFNTTDPLEIQIIRRLQREQKDRVLSQTSQKEK